MLLWGCGMGKLVRNGKYQQGYFDDILVDASAHMIQKYGSPILPQPG